MDGKKENWEYVLEITFGKKLKQKESDVPTLWFY